MTAMGFIYNSIATDVGKRTRIIVDTGGGYANGNTPPNPPTAPQAPKCGNPLTDTPKQDMNRIGGHMKKIRRVVSLRAMLSLSVVFFLVVLGDIPVVKAVENLTVEGEWEVISSSSGGESRIGTRMLISRKGDGYECRSVPDDNNPIIATGNQRRITGTYSANPKDLIHIGDQLSPSVFAQLPKQIGLHRSYTLSVDGNFLTRVSDTVNFYWKTNRETGAISNVRYEVESGRDKITLKRISGPPSRTEAEIAPRTSTSVAARPTRAETALTQRQQEAVSINEQGNQYYNNKQWQQAEAAYKAALDKNPDDPVIRKNLENARQQEAHSINEQSIQYYNNRQWQQAVTGFEAALDKNPNDPVIRQNYKNAVAAQAAEAAARVGPTSTTSPTAGGASGHTALDQAYTSNQETRQGLQSGSREHMKEQSNKVFDNPVPLQSSGINPAVDLRNVGKAPVLPVFVKKDKAIIQMQRDHDAYVATQQKKDAELTEIRQQIAAEPDSTKKADLMRKAVVIKAESSDAEYQAGVMNKEIEKRAKLLIDTHVEETPESGEQKKLLPDPPPDLGKAWNFQKVQ